MHAKLSGSVRGQQVQVPVLLSHEAGDWRVVVGAAVAVPLAAAALHLAVVRPLLRRRHLTQVGSRHCRSPRPRGAAHMAFGATVSAGCSDRLADRTVSVAVLVGVFGKVRLRRPPRCHRANPLALFLFVDLIYMTSQLRRLPVRKGMGTASGERQQHTHFISCPLQTPFAMAFGGEQTSCA